MDRTLVLGIPVPIPQGHRIEVTEQVDPETGVSRVLAVYDLDTSIRYQRAEEPTGEVSVWTGRVLRSTVTATAEGTRTALVVDPVSPGAFGAKAALRGADAAADAAKAEADRWGGGDRPPHEEPERFW